MAGWQSPQYDPGQQGGYDQTQYTPPPGQYAQPQTPPPQQYGQPAQYGQQVQPYEQYQPAPAAVRPQKTGLTGWEQFWYVVMCVFFGAGYFAKIPTAKALSELPQFRPAAGYYQA